MYIFFVFPQIVFCMGKLQGKILGAESGHALKCHETLQSATLEIRR